MRPVSRIHVVVESRRRPAGITIHRRRLIDLERSVAHSIPTTSPAATLIDLATQISLPRLEAAVTQADKLNLIRADELGPMLARFPRRPGLGTLKKLLNAHTFRLTDSELERRFLRLVRQAGLPLPQTGVYLEGFKTDFYWPRSQLVVETDGLTYHRTPSAQARDRIRDQAQIAAGLIPLRFTHDQVAHEPQYVAEQLARVIDRAN